MKFRESSFWPAKRALFRRRSRAGVWIGAGTVIVLLVVTMTSSQFLR